MPICQEALACYSTCFQGEVVGVGEHLGVSNHSDRWRSVYSIQYI